MDDGRLAADVGRLDGNDPDVRHHRRNGSVCEQQIPKYSCVDKECAGKKFAHRSKFDRNIENRECVEHNEDDEPGRQCRNEPDRQHANKYTRFTLIHGVVGVDAIFVREGPSSDDIATLVFLRYAGYRGRRRRFARWSFARDGVYGRTWKRAQTPSCRLIYEKSLPLLRG